jgi:hypothetical protein
MMLPELMTLREAASELHRRTLKVQLFAESGNFQGALDWLDQCAAQARAILSDYEAEAHRCLRRELERDAKPEETVQLQGGTS